MSDGPICGMIVATIDQSGVVTSSSGVIPALASHGMTSESFVGHSAYDVPHVDREGQLAGLASALLKREPAVVTVRHHIAGEVIWIRKAFIPTPDGCVLIAWDGHREPLEAVELEVLRGIADGLTHAEIGARLGLSASSSKRYLDIARRKLGAVNGCHAVALAMRRGLV